ncbi:PP2C family protein-serine/threonine phosphatase [Spirosoma utsteinense]|uniref:Protein phosphatase n=1 Tax=Spirosoma utsteinense TaxID=2585773 RepID=A0ABR6W943_9BACT|nr:protein phosphatase 2C domain-containing protein [Spirosoma utsteinense]MBC3787342.1 protein phosphatase [Spirosoma utsteinense]MBC3793104.1 protein phosphatase [Spirosoma utsteinense]
MYIEPTLPLAFSHIGQRAINQDSLFPTVGAATEQTGLFVVCDGMGGADKGEIASQLLCDTITEYAHCFNYPAFDLVHLRTALGLTLDKYQSYLRQHPLVGRMGSTLAILQFHEYGATVAHIGDSRIYQLRAGKIIFQTKDHKQVNDMVDAGIITATQALTHPWRNRLSRAVVVEPGHNPGQPTLPIPDLTVLTDIQKGDYFFMCTDGVLEQLDDYALETLLAGNIPDQAKVQSLVALCDGQTRDNYSGYLIGISQVQQITTVPLTALS